MVHQYYQSEVNNEYVIRGNAAILKCSIPSFVAEFVQVVGWQDDQGNSFNPDEKNGRMWRIVSSVDFAASPSTSYEGIDRSLEIACFPNFQKPKVDPRAPPWRKCARCCNRRRKFFSFFAQFYYREISRQGYDAITPISCRVRRWHFMESDHSAIVITKGLI